MKTQASRERFILAHKITRRTVRLYGGDYTVTFGAALKLVGQFAELVSRKYSKMDAPRWAKIYDVASVQVIPHIGDATKAELNKFPKNASIARIWDSMSPESQRMVTMGWLAQRFENYENN